MHQSARLNAAELKQLCLNAGAGDAGFVELGRGALDAEREDILAAYPRARTLIALAFPLNPENIRSPARHMSSAEVHNASDESVVTSRGILRALNAQGVRGVAVPADFPMDMGRFPGKIWTVSHKIVAVEAGLGHMGVNRLVLHPRFGSFLRLTSLVIDAEVDSYSTPLENSPCIHCGLCAAVCPVGAVKNKGPFDLMACMTHAYRDNALGFMDLLDAAMTSPGIEAFRQRFLDRETASMWQSLMYKMNYRCGYCMAVCPAGRPGGADFLSGRKAYVDEVVKPLLNRQEEVYVISGTPAEKRAAANGSKLVRRVVPLVERRQG